MQRKLSQLCQQAGVDKGFTTEDLLNQLKQGKTSAKFSKPEPKPKSQVFTRNHPFIARPELEETGPLVHLPEDVDSPKQIEAPRPPPTAAKKQALAKEMSDLIF